ncbi:MAG: EscU/YscU/HrcU family type III secretion system export apparatus switch protein [Leptospira sp.]|nr:EscU/YscU/HrcU family type III secretion system export apparatus switch protein [Leptospira sp.]
MKKKAIALAYDFQKQKAPAVIARGEGRFALEICRIAKEEGILIHEDPLLHKSLEHLKDGQEIPRELYEAVAIVFRILVSAPQKKNN